MARPLPDRDPLAALGLPTRRFWLTGRHAHGRVDGRATDAYLRADLRRRTHGAGFAYHGHVLELYVATDPATRLVAHRGDIPAAAAIDERAGFEAVAWPGADEGNEASVARIASVEGDAGVVGKSATPIVRSLDPDWAATLLDAAPVREAIASLLDPGGTEPPTRSVLHLRPGRWYLWSRGPGAAFTPEAVAARHAALAALAARADALSPPTRTAVEGRLERLMRARRDRAVACLLVAFLGCLGTVFVGMVLVGALLALLS